MQALLYSVEGLIGSAFGDVLGGLDVGETRNVLRGEGGSDVLYGRGGDDLLDGGNANDTLSGGDGADEPTWRRRRRSARRWRRR